jgi:N,N'-diacetylbacillosaminyl-diphospho-undecaprenol alpha-1,3-N-acetylgalactosaminyltransferase
MSKVAIIENSINEFFLSRKSFSDYLLKNFKLTVLVPYSTQHNFNYNKYNLCQYPLTRGERGITGALKTIWFLFWFFKKHKFDIIHTFKFEPNFYATLAARLAGSRYIINNINGLGIAFSGNSYKHKLLQLIIFISYQITFLLSDVVIFQNPDDLKLFKKKLLFVSKKFKLIEGSGVDINKYKMKSEYAPTVNELKNGLGIKNKKVILAVSRLIPEKGIYELYKASKYFSSDYIFYWAGSVDKENPHSQSLLGQINDSDNFKFLGQRKDILYLLALADVFVLPSYYREGIPRAILEAMSMSKPIITTDTPGCRETVKDGYNGFLVRPKSVIDLVRVIEQIFVLNYKNIGLNSRRLVSKKFSNNVVYNATKSIYLELLSN